MGNMRSARRNKLTVNTDRDSNDTMSINHRNIIEVIESEVNCLCKHASAPLELFANLDDTLETLAILLTAIESDDYQKHVIEMALKYNLEDIFVPAIQHAYEIVSKFLNKIFNNDKCDFVSELKSVDFKVTKLLLNILLFVNSLFDGPRTIALKFQEKNCAKSILVYLNDENFLVNSINFAEIGMYHKNPFKEDLSELLMIALHHLSKVADKFTQDFENLKLSAHLFTYISLMKVHKRHDKRIRAYLVLLNVMSEKDVLTCNDIDYIIDCIAKLLINASKSLSKGKYIERKRASVAEDLNELNNKVAIVMDKSDAEWNLVEIIDDLYALATHDIIKHKIYDKCNSKHDLSKIIYHGNDMEQQYAIKLLWKLCFNDCVAKSVSNDFKLVDYIRKLGNHSDLKNERLKRNCQGLLWLLRKNSDLSEENLSDCIKIKTKCDPYVMISYDTESIEFCLKLKDNLERLDFKIWMNTELSNMCFQIPTIEIENCSCAIVCVTERYKKSNYCREEAEYILKLNKPHIPLLMQKNFHNDGWIKKLFVTFNVCDFSAIEFDEALKNVHFMLKQFVIKEENVENLSILSAFANKPIERIDVDHRLDDLHPTFGKKPSSKYELNYSNWTNSDVTKWSVEKNLHNDFGELLKNLDGKLLFYLIKIKSDAPEYFYRTVSQDSQIGMDVVAKFVFELDELLIQS